MTTAALFIMLFGCHVHRACPSPSRWAFPASSRSCCSRNDSLASIALKLFEAVSEHYTLLAIPFFILSSAFLTTGGVARRLIRFAISVVG